MRTHKLTMRVPLSRGPLKVPTSIIPPENHSAPPQAPSLRVAVGPRARANSLLIVIMIIVIVVMRQS